MRESPSPLVKLIITTCSTLSPRCLSPRGYFSTHAWEINVWTINRGAEAVTLCDHNQMHHPWFRSSCLEGFLLPPLKEMYNSPRPHMGPGLHCKWELVLSWPTWSPGLTYLSSIFGFQVPIVSVMMSIWCLVSTPAVSGEFVGWSSAPAFCWYGSSEYFCVKCSVSVFSIYCTLHYVCAFTYGWCIFVLLVSAQFIIISFLAFPPDVKLFDYHYPPWTTVLGYCIGVSSFICVPIYMVYHLLNAKGTFKQV